LFRIARNAALETIERRGPVVPLDESHAGSDPTLDASAARADLVTAVRALPDRQRNVYALRELQGLRVGEIADRLDLQTEQVEQALFAARNKLAERLEFGERLDCASVKSLAEARLTRTQRRALKSHLRSCTECRSSSSVRAGALALPLGWLRDAAVAVFGGGAAKAAAVVATAAAVGSIPVVATHAPHMYVPGREQAIAPSVASHEREAASRPLADDSLGARFLGAPTPLGGAPRARALAPEVPFVAPAAPEAARARSTEPEPEQAPTTQEEQEEAPVERLEAVASEPQSDPEPIAEPRPENVEPRPADERPLEPTANAELEATPAVPEPAAQSEPVAEAKPVARDDAVTNDRSQVFAPTSLSTSDG
jgi:hypothetical protein